VLVVGVEDLDATMATPDTVIASTRRR